MQQNKIKKLTKQNKKSLHYFSVFKPGAKANSLHFLRSFLESIYGCHAPKKVENHWSSASALGRLRLRATSIVHKARQTLEGKEIAEMKDIPQKTAVAWKSKIWPQQVKMCCIGLLEAFGSFILKCSRQTKRDLWWLLHFDKLDTLHILPSHPWQWWHPWVTWKYSWRKNVFPLRNILNCSWF